MSAKKGVQGFAKDHGHTSSKGGKVSKTPTYNSWWSMICRCTYSTMPSYPYYGGRGIKVTENWLGKDGFINFLADMGERPEGTTLDRIDKDRDYEPNNCRWADIFTQNNNHSHVKYVTYQGKTMNVRNWAKTLGIRESIIYKRLWMGWSVEKAFTTPVKHRHDTPSHGNVPRHLES